MIQPNEVTMIDTSQVSIIIPHLGANRDMCYSLACCLESLKENSPDIRVIVAKNGKLACMCQRDLRLREQGQCKAVNAAVATTNTPWIMISNDDMIYPPNWWENLQLFKGLEDNDVYQGFSCISPKLVEPRSGAPTFDVLFCGGAGGDFDKQKWNMYAEHEMGIGNPLRTGFNFPVLIKRKLWDTIEGYDINYDPWGSNGDSDLQYKIMLAGIQPYQNTNCLVYHFSQTSGTFEPQNDSYRFRNYEYFKQKWGFMRTDDRIWESDFKIPTKEEGRIYLPEWEGKYK